jgi:hypothetical protein
LLLGAIDRGDMHDGITTARTRFDYDIHMTHLKQSRMGC